MEFKAEDYTYLWYMYTTYGMSSLTSADTLSLEKNLDTEITCIPGDYSLVFKVMDKETGITYTTGMPLLSQLSIPIPRA